VHHLMVLIAGAKKQLLAALFRSRPQAALYLELMFLSLLFFVFIFIIITITITIRY